MKYTLLASLLACLFITGCDSQNSNNANVSQERPLTVVEVKTVKPENYSITNELNGRTVATYEAEVRPQVSGILEKRLFDEGQIVKKGQILYQIDPSSYQATYQQALANLKVETAQLNSAKSKASRYQSLVANGNISKQDADDVVATYKQLLASIDAAKASLETAKINLDRTSIKAPISGKISISNFTPGSLVTENQTDALTTIREIDNIYVNLTQSSSELMKLRQYAMDKDKEKINNVSLIFDDGSLYSEKGTLLLSEINVDESTGTVTLRAIFPNKEHLLLPGMFVRAKVEQGLINNAFLIPEQGVSHDETGESYVMVVDNGKVSKRVIETSVLNNHEYVITKGLKSGDQVILVNSNKVRIGDTVKVQEYKSKSEGGVI